MKNENDDRNDDGDDDDDDRCNEEGGDLPEVLLESLFDQS